MNALPAFFTTPLFGTPAWFWLAFLLLIIVLLVLDLGVLHRDQHEIEVRESLLLYAGYFSVGVAFGGWIGWELGTTKAMEFYTGLLVEQSLSMDNLFVMAMILGYFGIPRRYQHRVLFWGILGVIVLRAIMIGLGTALVRQFDWILYVFGAFLLLSGIRMLRSGDDAPHPNPAQNPLIRFVRRRLRVTDKLHDGRFLVRLPDASGKTLLHATPLLLALILIELADLVFAVDSVPAVLAISQDPFIVYTSNIFAILGLRALYFALAALLHRFIYLKYALALVLMYIGGKIILHDLFEVPALLSLGVTLALLAGGVLFSLLRTRDQKAIE
ncbi:TerC/Alx family metal homeostasis membrane protein [Pseudomonas sp. C11]|uniref:TerC/Alx family metal homeostasis membrane protein n=1 Tax=Pseudomonas sp. C11 TaxID=3075550 RepID=UPI002AFED392|nr:TerC/Alx family metal homeostasis membrane protein [Pseudomonas sp. C11]